MKELTVLLGAGFSFNAGLPLGSTVSAAFNRDIREKLLNFTSSEWLWIDGKSDAYIHNGHNSYSSLGYSYILDETRLRYEQEKGWGNYEEFFQFLTEKSKDTQWCHGCMLQARERLLTDKEYLQEGLNDENYYSAYLQPFKDTDLTAVIEIVNYLIADLVARANKNDTELIRIYQPFFNFLEEFDKVQIFTLNHDLLLEHLMRLFNKPYSRGFSKDHSPIRANEETLPFFNDSFNEKISIYKLHGSIDFFQFRRYQKDGMIYRSTDQVNYFYTSNYTHKHNAKLFDPDTGSELQEYNFDIVPKFLTGTKKSEIMKNDVMYSALFQTYERTIVETENLLVSGYSFMDPHIDALLKKHSFQCVVNHNPFSKYPYQKASNIKSLDALVKKEVQ